ncbi:MAG: ABC transporter permease [Pseudomonadota bacterium]
MNIVGLMWANLFRKPMRTTLTILSVVIAFLLFGLLQSIGSAFEGGAQVAGVDRLVVAAKYSQIDNLPYAQKQQILSVEGVDGITHTSWFGGNYQDPKNFFAKFPVDPVSYFDIYNELDLQPADALERFIRERNAAVVDVALAERFGWQVGDVIPIIGTIYSKSDGDRLWEFTLVGTYSENGEASNFPLFLFNYEYFNESTAFGRDQVGQWTVRIDMPERAGEIAQQIDALFENSTDPTRTASEDEANRQFARQLGDMGFITTMIMSAVFFTIILLTGNTMSQALRERIPELAVLKTLGFTDATVSLLILGEAVMLCLLGGLLGGLLALGLGPIISAMIESFFGSFEVSNQVVLNGLGLSLVVGLLIGMIPALSAQRLAIVDALRGL